MLYFPITRTTWDGWHGAGAARRPGARMATREPPIVAALAGAWRGALYPSDSHTGLPFSLVLEASAEGLSAGRFAFMSTMIPRADARLLEASAGSFVLLIGPYYDPYLEADMMTRVEGRRAGDRIFGTLYTSQVTGERASFARFMATRSRPKAPAAGAPARPVVEPRVE